MRVLEAHTRREKAGGRMRREQLLQPRAPAECGEVQRHYERLLTLKERNRTVGRSPSRRAGVKLLEVAEYLGDAPCLCHASARSIRLLGVEDLADRADAGLIQVRLESFEHLAGAGSIARVHFQPRVDVRADEPGPDGALMVRGITCAEVPKILGLVVGVTAEPAIEDPPASAVAHARHSAPAPIWPGRGSDARARRRGSDWAGMPNRFPMDRRPHRTDSHPRRTRTFR